MTTDEPRSPAEILARYRDGERDFRELEILETEDDPASFRGAILDDADLSGCFITADFTNASLRGCRFVLSNVKTCRFDGADLRGCDFSGAAVDSATFRGARRDGATFAGATAYGYTFRPGELPEW